MAFVDNCHAHQVLSRSLVHLNLHNLSGEIEKDLEMRNNKSLFLLFFFKIVTEFAEIGKLLVSWTDTRTRLGETSPFWC